MASSKYLKKFFGKINKTSTGKTQNICCEKANQTK